MDWKFWKKKKSTKEEKNEIDRYILVGFAPHPTGGLSTSEPLHNYRKNL